MASVLAVVTMQRSAEDAVRLASIVLGGVVLDWAGCTPVLLVGSVTIAAEVSAMPCHYALEAGFDPGFPGQGSLIALYVIFFGRLCTPAPDLNGRDRHLRQGYAGVWRKWTSSSGGGIMMSRGLSIAVALVVLTVALAGYFRTRPSSRRVTGQAAIPDGFPYELVECSGKDAPEILSNLQQLGREKGFFPVIAGDAGDVANLNGALEAAENPEEIIGRSKTVRVRDWIDGRLAEEPEWINDFKGDWPAEAPEAISLTAHLDLLTNKPKKRIYIAKVPARFAWEIPAYLGFGGWNACPPPEVQVAFSQYWFEEYGAEIVAVTGATVQYLVSRPPGTKESALALAREQGPYCPDIIEQGCGDLSSLAATLLQSKWWYFWWD